MVSELPTPQPVIHWQSKRWPTGGEHAGVPRSRSIQHEATSKFESKFWRESESPVLFGCRGDIATVTRDNTN